MTSRIVQRAMNDPDTFALQVRYESKTGEVTDRIVSPIRFIGETAFLALCLCREEPRRFELTQCKAFRLVRADDVLMPVEIVTHKKAQ
jgi:predicted DNA-binding transcriptional regulator YafY